LSPEFEAGKSPPAQRPPQIPFRVRLITAKLAGGGDRVHPDRMQTAAKNSSRALLLPLLVKSFLLRIGWGDPFSAPDGEKAAESRMR
jgi:hypothetical protein